tara:strand:+ start:544 stop:1131 length:588 start_codon:yes stop_codon:yes gene_type:complete
MEISIDSLLKSCHKCGDLLSGTKSLTNGVTNTFRELSLQEIFETMHGYCGDTDWDYSGEIIRLKTKFKLEGIDDRRPFCYRCLKEEDIHEGPLHEDPEEYLLFIENEIKEIETFKLCDIDPMNIKKLSDLKDIRDELKVIVFPEVPSVTEYGMYLREKHDEVKYQEFLCKEKDDEHKYRMEEIEKLIENEATKKC